MTAPSPPLRSYEAELESILARVEALEVASRSPQLGGSSIDDGVLQIRGPDGTIVETWGMQPDGTAGTKSLNKVPPPPPGAPDVTPTIAGIDVAWSGQLTGNLPADFQAVRVHVSIVPDFIVGDSNYVGSLSRAGAIPVAPLPYVPHYVKLVAVNKANAASLPSLQAVATPKKVVADSVLDGIVTETSLAAAAVTKAKLAAQAVTQTAIAPGAVGTPQLIAGSVQTAQLAADAVAAGKVAADAITAREVKALSLTGDLIAANQINAGHVRAGAVTSDKLAADLVLGTRLIAGDPTGTRVELSASGMLVVKESGEKTFEVDASTGDVTSYGTYYTSRYGERLALNAGGIGSPMMRAYPTRGNYYATLGARTSGTPSGNPVAFWRFGVPYQSLQAVGFVEFIAENTSNRADIASSKLWYRPYVDAGGVVIPGLQAFHQDVAFTFSSGCIYVRNNGNSAGRDFSVRRLYCDNIAMVGNSMFSWDYDGAVRWESNGAFSICNRAGTAGRGIYATNYAPWGSSWRSLKTDHTSIAEYLGHSALDEVRGLDINAWRYRDDAATGDGGSRKRIGLHLDELHPRLRMERHDERGDASTWDTVELLNVALAAVQDADRETAELREEVATQRSLIERLTARLDRLEKVA